MLDYNQVLYSFEVHSVEGIQNYFREGGDPNEEHDGVPLFTTLVEMYTRTPRFKECVKAFVQAGLVFENQSLLAVLLDDAKKLEEMLAASSIVAFETFSLFKNTYTPLLGAPCFIFVLSIMLLNAGDCLFRPGLT
jgi:hypothetical protein